jgi:hypothetical protein
VCRSERTRNPQLTRCHAKGTCVFLANAVVTLSAGRGSRGYRYSSALASGEKVESSPPAMSTFPLANNVAV